MESSGIRSVMYDSDNDPADSDYDGSDIVVEVDSNYLLDFLNGSGDDDCDYTECSNPSKEESSSDEEIAPRPKRRKVMKKRLPLSDANQPSEDSLATSLPPEQYSADLVDSMQPPVDPEQSYSDSDSTLVDLAEPHVRNWYQVNPPEEPVDIKVSFQVNTGPANIPPGTITPNQFFSLFFTNAVWQYMVTQTNTYAHTLIDQQIADRTFTSGSRLSRWVDVSIKEMQCFWGLIINMGITKKKMMRSHWSTDENEHIPFYSKRMSLKRFEAIMSMLHVSKRTPACSDQHGFDPWIKVHRFIGDMNTAFKKYFVPNQEICIDESMIGRKNRRVYNQSMPNKRHSQYGIKKFQLCDSKTGYVLQSIMYPSRDLLANGSKAYSYKVVKELLKQCGMLGKNYHLFTDNFYTKLSLATWLLRNGTYLTGTINKGSKALSSIITGAELGVGQSIYFRNEQFCGVLLVKYMEKARREPVHLITTAWHTEDVEVVSKSGKRQIKPIMIHRYNQHMSEVDCKDKTSYHSTCFGQMQNYWKGIMYNFVDMAIYNAYVLYNINTQMPMNRHAFMNSLVISLTEPEQPVAPAVPVANVELGHTLERLPGKNLRICKVCRSKGKLKKTNFWCPKCKLGVHQGCFEAHQQPHQEYGRCVRRHVDDESDSTSSED